MVMDPSLPLVPNSTHFAELQVQLLIACHLRRLFSQAAGVSSEMPARSATPDSSSPAKVKNEAGPPSEPAKSFVESLLQPVQALAKRAAVYVAFIAAKQPSRIKQVLQQVLLPPAAFSATINAAGSCKLDAY